MDTDHEIGPRRLSVLARASGAVAAAFGGAALVAWLTGSTILATLGAERIPMAPSTALLFLLYGALLVLLPLLQRRRSLRRVGIALAALGTIASLLLLALSSSGIHPAIEHIGLKIAGTVAGAPVGHISPLTAACFSLAGTSLLLLSSASRRSLQTTGLVLAIALVLTGSVLTVAYVTGGPILYDSGVIPPALTTSLAFLALGTALIADSGRQIWPRQRKRDEAHALSPAVAIPLFVVLIGGIIMTAHFYLLDYQKRFRSEVENELLAVADLKVNELVHWRMERLSDAGVFFGNSSFSEVVQHYRETPGDLDVQSRLRTWLNKVQASSEYSQLLLLDPQGDELMVSPLTSTPISTYVREEAQQVALTGAVTFLDFYRDGPDEPVHLAVLVPIRDSAGDRAVLGILVLNIDPRTYLYPMIQSWPTSKKTAETLLVRRDGDDVLFLNDLRFSADAALRLRIPVGQADLPAAMAVSGTEGIVEGNDYRGIMVAAAVRSVPNSPWFLVARMDTQEIYAPLQERLWWVIGLIGILVLGIGGIIGWAWQRNAKTYYRRLYEAETRYEITLRSIGDGVITTDSAGRVTLLNPVAETLTGWSQDVAKGKPLDEIFRIINEETRQPVESPVARVLQEGRIVGLANHTVLISRDGIDIPIADSGAPITDTGDRITGVVLIFRDQTEERAANQRLRAEMERSQRYLDVAGVMILALDADANVMLINKKGREILGYGEAEIIGRNWIEHFIPDHARVRVSEAFSQLMAGQSERAAYVENAILTSAGAERIIAWRNAALVDESGRISGMLSSGQDITEQVLAEAERRELSAQVEAQARQITEIMDTVPQGVLLLDTNGRVLLANPAAERNLLALGQGSTDALTHIGKQPLSEFLTSPPKGLWHEVQAEGRFFEIIARPMVEGPEPERWVLVINDATQERQVRDQLQQQERLAAIGQLAAGIAHDFNNIMAVIILQARLAANSEGISEQDRRRLETVNQQAYYATRLIQQILDFSRRAILERQPLDLLPLIKEQVRLLERTLPENIAIHFGYDAEAHTVNADPTRIQQVIMQSGRQRAGCYAGGR